MVLALALALDLALVHICALGLGLVLSKGQGHTLLRVLEPQDLPSNLQGQDGIGELRLLGFLALLGTNELVDLL